VALMFCSQRRVERRRGPDAAISDSDKMLAEHVRLEESNLDIQVEREGGQMIGFPDILVLNAETQDIHRHCRIF
jgi:hypothetical protein